MGDMADYENEQGEDAYFTHLNNMCDDDCQYCYEADILMRPSLAIIVKQGLKKSKQLTIKKTKKS